MAHFLDLLELEAGLQRDLLGGRLATEAHGELALDAAHLAGALGDVHGQADRAPGVLEAPLDRLADPQRGVGGEAEALAPVELLAGADQAEHPLLHEVGERQALVLVATRVGGHQAQVGVDHQFLRAQVPALDPLRQFDLLVGREQGVAPRVREQLVDGLGDEAFGFGGSHRTATAGARGGLGTALREGRIERSGRLRGTPGASAASKCLVW